MSKTTGSIAVAYTSIRRPEEDPNYRGFKPGQTLLSKGHRLADDRAAFQSDTIWDRDIPIRLRDGVTIRADVFRPAGSEHAVPGLVAWGPYGKTGQGSLNYGLMPGRAGVPKDRTSGYESFEAPDPAAWVAKGYAICNVDARGVYDSEGDLVWWGTQEGRDGYDAIEHLASLPWCNGSLALVGNSWLAVSQYFIAAEQPPHLKCIAPLEGLSDVYRENICRGGLVDVPFAVSIQMGLFGRNSQEDVPGMLAKHPQWNEYWEDKRARFDKVKVPSYILASYSTPLHTEGSFRAYEQIPAPKWLRVHATQEWHDLYRPETTDDLQRFFDRYTKGVDNGWEATTPAVRMALLPFNKPAIANHPFEDFPVPSTKYQTLYLDARGTMSPEKPSSTTTTGGSRTYQSDAPFQQRDNDTGELVFEHEFDGPTTLAGYPTATLHMCAPEHDDLVTYVQLRKADRSGRILCHVNIPAEDSGLAEPDDLGDVLLLKYQGPTGVLRASQRQLDESLSRPFQPVLSHSSTQSLGPGEVVALRVSMWPLGMVFEKGEKLVVKIAGHDLRFPGLEFLRGQSRTGNKGVHKLFCGEDGYHSEVTIPLVARD